MVVAPAYYYAPDEPAWKAGVGMYPVSSSFFFFGGGKPIIVILYLCYDVFFVK